VSLMGTLMVDGSAKESGLVRAFSCESWMGLHTGMDLFRGDGTVLVPFTQHGFGRVYPDAEVIALAGLLFMRSHGVSPHAARPPKAR
jgi:hypothetical protein